MDRLLEAWRPPYPSVRQAPTSGILAPRGKGLLVEECENPGDSGRLARPGSAGHDGRVCRRHRGHRGEALQRIRVDPSNLPIPSLNTRGPQRPPRASARGEEVLGHLTLVAPVPVQVQRASLRGAEGGHSPTRALATSRSVHSPRIRPGKCRRGHRGLDIGVGSPTDRLQIHAGVAETRGAHRQRRGKQDDSSSSEPPSRTEAACDVDVGRDEHARLVERAQQAVGPARETAPCRFGAEEVLRACLSLPPPRSKRSLSSSTSRRADATTRPRTASPPAVGNSGLLMPRTNR